MIKSLKRGIDSSLQWKTFKETPYLSKVLEISDIFEITKTSKFPLREKLLRLLLLQHISKTFWLYLPSNGGRMIPKLLPLNPLSNAYENKLIQRSIVVLPLFYGATFVKNWQTVAEWDSAFNLNWTVNSPMMYLADL